jgi:hypothetical protein
MVFTGDENNGPKEKGIRVIDRCDGRPLLQDRDVPIEVLNKARNRLLSDQRDEEFSHTI